MENNKRQSGFYRVNYEGVWHIAKWSSTLGWWSWHGRRYNGSIFSKIDERLINPIPSEESKEFELKFCEKCIQMTNHIDGVCQKCKPIKSAEEMVVENLRGLQGFIRDKDILQFYYDLVKTMLEEYASQSEPINQKLLQALRDLLNFDAKMTNELGHGYFTLDIIENAERAIQQAKN
jgi:hypothetical protein